MNGSSRRAVAVILMSLALAAGPAMPAGAEGVTVPGTGSLEKMRAINGAKAVTVKLWGPGGTDCEIKYLSVTLRGTDGKRYQATGGCYGVDWITSLSHAGELVSCDGFKLTYNATNGFWRAFVPRACLSNLTNRIKVSSYINDWSPQPAEAGPTKWLKRG